MTNSSSEKIASINTVITDFYRPLYDQFFLPSLANSPIAVIAHTSPYYGAAFGQWEFEAVIHFKITKIIESLKQPANHIVIWSDLDIFFLKPIQTIINDLQKRMQNIDLLGSRERINEKYINTGFLVLRCTEVNIQFFQELLKRITTNRSTEQPEFNNLINKPHNVKWGVLPPEYWNITVHCSVDPFFAHANWIALYPGKTYVEQKIKALNTIKKSFIKFN